MSEHQTLKEKITHTFRYSLDPHYPITPVVPSLAAHLRPLTGPDDDCLLLNASGRASTNTGRFLFASPSWFAALEFGATWDRGNRFGITGDVLPSRSVTKVTFTEESGAYGGYGESPLDVRPSLEITVAGRTYTVGPSADFTFGIEEGEAEAQLVDLFRFLS